MEVGPSVGSPVRPARAWAGRDDQGGLTGEVAVRRRHDGARPRGEAVGSRRVIGWSECLGIKWCL